MTILSEVRTKIKKILVYFETGQFSDYSSVYVYTDSKNGTQQVTLSLGFTQDYTLKQVLVAYCKEPTAQYGKELKPYIRNIQNPLLYQDKRFLQLLQISGLDPSMQKIQDELFQKFYLQPAEDWAVAEGFSFALSLLVIADSYLHSGKIPMDIRLNFAEKTPINGGNEKEWVKQYLLARKEWLSSRKLEAVRKTIYRPNCFLEAIYKNNWSLLAPINANGTIIK